MNATSHLVFDRAYYEVNYDDWLAHRSKLRRFAIPMASALLLFGIVMAVLYRQQWLVGVVFALLGTYELAEAITHKSRWVNARLKTTRPEKSVDIRLSESEMTTTSTNGTSTIKMSAIDEIIAATNGVFLIPETGVSIYIPQATVDPSDMYLPLIQSWIATNTSARQPGSGE